jgi:hypothetical protein
MASSSQVEPGRENGNEGMGTIEVPAPLVERLGERGTDGLVVLLRSAQREWAGDVIALVEARFERRLTDEISRVRVDLTGEIGKLRGEMGALRADVSRELASARVDQVRWSFAFWIGQVAATAGLLAWMLRSA